MRPECTSSSTDAAIAAADAPRIFVCIVTYYFLYCNILSRSGRPPICGLRHNDPVSTAPLAEYRERLRQRTGAHEALSARDAGFSYARLAVFAAFALLAALAWRGSLAWWWLLVPIAVFISLIRAHDGVIRRRVAAERGIQFYTRGVARIEDRWIGTGEPGDRFKDDSHLYANDLDLFGKGSLFELLSIARTRAGEETLAAWLKQPATHGEIQARREAVTELAPQLDLRERIALAGSDVRAGVNSEALLAWASGPPLLVRMWPRWIAAALCAAAIVTAIAWGVTGSSAPFVAVVVIEILFSTPLRVPVDTALHAASAPARDLDILAHVLCELEAAQFDSPRLRELRERLRTHGLAASVAIRRLHRLLEWHDWQHNPFFALIGAALMWGTQLAYAIEHWRSQHGAQAAVWLRSVAEFEALGSLSAYRYEHPEDPFPEIVDSPAARYEGEALGHPLIPASRAVRNDVALAAERRLLVVSGSNMSGKSTLLRTVGVNAVLAFAGAPVRATRLRLTPLAIGATLRIQDSLQEGRSRFYAEITRIRDLATLAGGEPPLLFLLDEIFHGTNSHDRLIGAAGVLNSLLDRGAIGLVTTHDLALTAIAAELAPRAANVHFEDRFEQGEIVFDYRMKPGPVTRSNAIALMRAVGLDVGQDVTHE